MCIRDSNSAAALHWFMGSGFKVWFRILNKVLCLKIKVLGVRGGGVVLIENNARVHPIIGYGRNLWYVTLLQLWLWQ